MNARTNSRPNSPRRGVSWAAALCVTALASSALVATSSVQAAPLAAQATEPTSDVPADHTYTDLIADLEDGDGVVEPRLYKIDEPLELDTDTTLTARVPGQTTIEFTGVRSSAIKVTGQNVTISGVTITGGDNANGNGGGIDITRGSSLTLVESTVTGNFARQGGGIHNAGDLTIERSTIDNNQAERKGGGLRDDGTTTIVNSTFNANIASQGGAVSSAGTTDIVHATIVGNIATSSSSAGVDRNGGSLTVSYSIIGNNLRTNGSAASDCSGTPDLLELNLVTDDSGCNPVGTVLVSDPMVDTLTDNGGPTATMALLAGSPALDAIGLVEAADGPECASETTTDQRGTERPTDAGCELGAYERGQLAVDIDLAVDTGNYSSLGVDNTVEVGVTSVPTSAIVGELAARTVADEDGTVDASGLRRIGLRRIDIGDLGDTETVDDNGDPVALPPSELKAIGLRRISLESIGLRRIGLRRIDIDSTGLRRIGLPTIPLSEIPLLVDGGWEGLLAGTGFAGVPLQSITLEDISGNDAAGDPLVDGLDDLTLQSIDLSSTGLRRISLPSILLTELPLEAVQVGNAVPDDADYAQAWCESLFGTAACSDPTFVDEVGGAELWEAQLAGADVETDDVFGVPLGGLTAAGLRRIDIEDAGLRRIGLRRIGLRRIFIENTGLRRIELSDIGLRRIDLDGDGEEEGIESIIDCSPIDGINPCSTDDTNTLTLGDIAAGCVDPADGASTATCRLRPEATVGQLLDLLGVEIDGVSLLDGLTLYDLLFAFVPPEDVPWETIDLDQALLQNVAVPPQPTFDYLTTVSVVEGPADVDVSLLLPDGFAVAAAPNPDPATWCPATDAACLNEVAPNAPLELGNPTYSIDDVASGEYVLRVPVRAGLSIGDADQFPTFVSVEGAGPNGEAPLAEAGPVGVNVVEAASGGPGRAPILDDGQLQLGHIGSSDDVDLYSFTTPEGTTGASARILLSNIPTGVDYDLSVYGPRPGSLRNPPTRTLNSLGDVDFDLDPSDDALSTDLANDIAIDVNVLAADIDELVLEGDYALRDISSRRSNNDEEVDIAALEQNTTYVVAVSGYFGDLSTEPYGLRVRLDRRSALPPCATVLEYPDHAPPTAETPPALNIGGGTNTLYVTNAARLDAEAAGRSGDIIAAIADTEDVNGVDAGLLLVDDLDAFDGWNDDSCDVDARNDVVRQIGAAIDGAMADVEDAGGSIENLVIVGGDGVIPMAAVPDLTEYSNEATFAREVLSDSGSSNAAAGTIGNGYLLSDDPYATDAGISILGGDHELHVPERNIGRLVETADEIVGQLENFADPRYNGLLDPATFSDAASVTGYDFLDDGAQAIIDALDTDGPFDASNSLQGPAWDKDAFLGLFDGGADYSVISPNAHYDYESLLPAAADTAGYFTDEQLVTTADVSELATPPTNSLIFTVGCHAGFSVSDVQLGLTGALDWAQLYGSTGNQYVAHTTYGYGDTDIVAYSERLAALFAANVAAMVDGEPGAPTSLGAAVRLAKQQYLASTLVLTPYDEKILQSWTYYGLPMYDLGPIVEPPVDVEAAGTSSFADAFGATTLDLTSSSLTVPVSTGPVTFAFDEAVDGVVPVAIDLAGDALELNPTDDGSYYSVDGNTIVAQYRTVQPLVDVAIPTDGESDDEYGGFLITGLVSEDLDDYVPFVSRPVIDNSVDESRIVVDDSAFPATLQRIGEVGDQQRLLVAAGQYEANQRLFREIRGELLPRVGDDDVPSRFIDVSGQTVSDVGTTGRGVQFDIVTDAKAARVVVVYREVGANQWRSVELAGTSVDELTTRWFGSAPLDDPAADVEFFAQNAAASGAVGITSRKIENFLATEAVDPETGLEIVYTGEPDKQLAGRFFASGAAFDVNPESETTTFSVDSGEPRPYNPETGIRIVFDPDNAGDYVFETGTITLDRGAHVLFAQDESLDRVYRFFILDPQAPTVTTSTTRSDDGVDVTITAVDSLSGVRSTEYSCSPATCTELEPEDGDGPGTLRIRYEGAGDTTVSATATDNVGNTSEPVTTFIDRTPPDVTISAAPAGWTNADSVVVTITAQDTGSGVQSIFQDCTTCEVVEPFTIDEVGTATLRIRSSAEGVTDISATATDTAGNTSEAVTTTTFVDRTPPTTTLSVTPDPSAVPGPDVNPLYVVGESISVEFTCADGTSGDGPEQSPIETCQLLDGTDVVADAGPAGTGTYVVDTSGPGTHSFSVAATDAAGNSSLPTVPIPVVVAYNTCLLYDDTQEKNVGSNYTIKVQVCDADGNDLSSRNITLTALTIDGSILPGPNFQGNSNNGFVFRFTRSNSAYTYNLDTDMLDGDGTQHFLYFTTEPVPSGTTDVEELQALATNAAPFRLR